MPSALRSSVLAFLVACSVGAAGCTAETTEEDPDVVDVAEAAVTAVSFDVPWISQKPELPRGCEVTSLAMMLRHAGVNVDKMTLADEVKKVPYATGALRGDPFEGFVGNMYTFAEPGYGVYHGPIKALADDYLPGRVLDLTGSSFDDVLQQHVAKKRPVWIVTNARFEPLDATRFETWQTKAGPVTMTWHEHSVVIVGFDAKTIIINDPLDPNGKNKKLPRTPFRLAWEQMGKQAITYVPASMSAPALPKTNAPACAGKTIPSIPTSRPAGQLAPYVLDASHGIGLAELRPGDALNRNVAGAPSKSVAFFAGWADALRTTACVVPANGGTTATALAYGPAALREVTPIRFENSPGGYRSAPMGAACSVQADGRLYCTNRGGAVMRATPNLAAATVNHLRTTYSWFECWGTGDRHAGGNTTWYRTIGDDNPSRGWVAGVDLRTPDAFDADPAAHGLRRCAP